MTPFIQIERLEHNKNDQIRTIQDLMEKNYALNQTLARAGLTTPSPTLYPSSLQVCYRRRHSRAAF